MPTEHDIAAFRATPWAMLHDAWDTVASRFAYDSERDPPQLAPCMYEQAVADEPMVALDVPRATGTVAVVPIYGVIENKRSFWGDVFTDELAAMLGSLMATPNIGAVVLDVDSPGGSVYGVPELSDQIRSYRSTDKPLYAIATGDMASAAYWLGSAAAKVFAIPSARVGSIGVWSAHLDMSKALEQWGYKITVVQAGKYKTEGNPWEPLKDEARAEMQREVDHYYGMFLEAVAHNRRRQPQTVRERFGEGRMLNASKAAEAGMIDGVATLPQLLSAIVPRRRGSKAATAAAQVMLAEQYMVATTPPDDD